MRLSLPANRSSALTRSLARVVLVTLLLCGTAMAVKVRQWSHQTEADFLPSEREQTVITNLGEVQLSRALAELAELEEDDSVIYDLARTTDGRVYAAAGPKGQLFQFDAEAEELTQRGEYKNEQVFTLLADGKTLWVGISGAKSRVEQLGDDGQATRTIDLPEVRYVWDMVRVGDTLWIATGTDGKILTIDLGEDDPSVVTAVDSKQPNVLCLAAANGTVYAGTDGEGLVYRIRPKGEQFSSFIMYDAAEPEIGALLAKADGTLYVGTADAEEARPGRMTELPSEDVGRPAPEAGKPAPPVDQPRPAPLPGDDPGEGDSSGDTAPAAASTDSANPQTAAAPAEAAPQTPEAPVAAKPTGEQYNELRQAIRDRLAQAKKSGGISVRPMARRSSGPARRSSGRNGQSGRARPGGAAAGEGNAVYLIDPDGFVREVFRESVMVLRLMASGDDLLIATGNEGQLYRVNTSKRETAVLADIDPQQIPALLDVGDGRILAATANPARLLRLSEGFAAEGTLTTDPLDAAQISKWGALQVTAATPEGTTVTVQTRSGNVGEPEEGSWSDWSDAQPLKPTGEAVPVHLPVASPSARYIQYRLTLGSDGGATPSVSGVGLKYLMPNIAPRITGLKAQYADSGKKRGDEKNGQPAPRSTLAIEWEVEDPNEDQLRYTLEMRKLGEKHSPFIPITKPLTETTYEWDTRSIPDGRYILRVTASDELDNIPAQAKTTAHLSRPVVIDNTAPSIHDFKVTTDPAKPGQVQVRLKATDGLTPIGVTRYAVDGEADWQAVLPDDLIYDSTSETVSFTISDLSPGPHVVAVRAEDSQANSRFASQAVVVPGK
jgi:hypothetical protein